MPKSHAFESAALTISETVRHQCAYNFGKSNCKFGACIGSDCAHERNDEHC